MRSLVPSLLGGLLALASISQEAAEPTPGPAVQLSTSCARCHANAPGASAMRAPHGAGVAPYDLWRGTMAVLADVHGDPTYVLLRGAGFVVDDRLLPRGWSPTHPAAALPATLKADEVHAVLGGIQLGYYDANHHVKRLMIRASSRVLSAEGGWTSVQATLQSMVHDGSADDRFSANADVILLGGKRRGGP